MSLDFSPLFEAHRLLLAELDARAEAAAEKEAHARKMLDECVAERRDIERQRAALTQAEQLYRHAFSNSAPLSPRNADDKPPFTGGFFFPTDDSASGRVKPRARIGPQRYRMLKSLQGACDPLPASIISSMTQLDLRRVKDQMASDAGIGVVAGDENGFILTDEGADLLYRFEAYKRSKGQPLPPLTGQLSEDDQREVGTETKTEGGEQE